MRIPPDTDSATKPQPRVVARQSPGLHLIGDLYGCRGHAGLMTDAPALEAFCKQAVLDAGLTIVGSLFHSFGVGQGVTGAVVLAESHLAVHTWPELDAVTLDLYVCNFSQDNSAAARAAFDALIAAFQPMRCERRELLRGQIAP